MENINTISNVTNFLPIPVLYVLAAICISLSIMSLVKSLIYNQHEHELVNQDDAISKKVKTILKKYGIEENLIKVDNITTHTLTSTGNIDTEKLITEKVESHKEKNLLLYHEIAGMNVLAGNSICTEESGKWKHLTNAGGCTDLPWKKIIN